MFKIDAEPKFITDVKVNTLALQGEFSTTYRVLPSDELKALDNGEPDSWKQLLARVVVGFGPVEIAGTMIKGGRRCALMRTCARWSDCVGTHEDLAAKLAILLEPKP